MTVIGDCRAAKFNYIITIHQHCTAVRGCLVVGILSHCMTSPVITQTLEPGRRRVKVRVLRERGGTADGMSKVATIGILYYICHFSNFLGLQKSPHKVDQLAGITSGVRAKGGAAKKLIQCLY